MVFLTLLFVASVSHALDEYCSEVDLNKGEGSPLQHMKIQNQVGSQLCYAYVAAAQVDYYRLKKGLVEPKPGWETNPVYAGMVEHVQSGNTRAFTSGKQERAYAAIKEYGACSDLQVTKVWNEMKQAGGLNDAQLLYFLGEMHNTYSVKKNRSLAFMTYASRLKAERESFMEEVRGIKDWKALSAEQQRAISNRYVKLEKRISNAIEQRAEFKRFTDGLKKAEVGSCDRLEAVAQIAVQFDLVRVPPVEMAKRMLSCRMSPEQLQQYRQLPPMSVARNGSDAEMERRIDYAFLTQMPPAINLCSSMFTNTSYRGVGDDTFPRDHIENIKADCAHHSALVTARKNIGGQCHYLVRNSWGSTWYPSGATTCACRKPDSKGKLVYHDSCERGLNVEYVGCWFKSADLLANTSSINVLQ